MVVLVIFLIVVLVAIIVTATSNMDTANIDNFSPKPKTTPKDFFLNLGWLITLYGSVVSLLSLLFGVINRIYPDLVAGYYSANGYSAGIRWAIAWLIILFPIYVIVTRYLRKGYIVEPARREIWVRKWFVYFTLFLSSAAVVVDIIVLINSFLGGELTSRFLLKVLATLAVSTIVFGYYFYDLRQEGISNKKGAIFATISIVVVVASLVWAFVVIGSPMTERARRFDEQKISNLQDIQWRVINYWQSKGTLPNNLSDLVDSVSGYVPPTEPDSALPYVYQKIGPKSFELCANFNLPTDTSNMTAKIVPGDNWVHDKGQKCFERTIDEQLYPVKLQTVR